MHQPDLVSMVYSTLDPSAKGDKIGSFFAADSHRMRVRRRIVPRFDVAGSGGLFDALEERIAEDSVHESVPRSLSARRLGTEKDSVYSGLEYARRNASARQVDRVRASSDAGQDCVKKATLSRQFEKADARAYNPYSQASSSARTVHDSDAVSSKVNEDTYCLYSQAPSLARTMQDSEAAFKNASARVKEHDRQAPVIARSTHEARHSGTYFSQAKSRVYTANGRAPSSVRGTVEARGLESVSHDRRPASANALHPKIRASVGDVPARPRTAFGNRAMHSYDPLIKEAEQRGGLWVDEDEEMSMDIGGEGGGLKATLFVPQAHSLRPYVERRADKVAAKRDQNMETRGFASFSGRKTPTAGHCDSAPEQNCAVCLDAASSTSKDNYTRIAPEIPKHVPSILRSLPPGKKGTPLEKADSSFNPNVQRVPSTTRGTPSGGGAAPDVDRVDSSVGGVSVRTYVGSKPFHDSRLMHGGHGGLNKGANTVALAELRRGTWR